MANRVRWCEALAYGLVFLGMAGSVTVAQEAVSVASKSSVISFFPTRVGLVVKTKGLTYRGSELVRRATIEMTVLPPEIVAGREMKVHELRIRIVDTTGRVLADGSPLKVLFVGDDRGWTTVGMQKPHREMNLLDHPYPDLQAPLRVGASWSFEDENYLAHPQVGEVHIEITTTIREVGAAISAGEREFTGCIHTEEKGIVREHPEILCSDGTRSPVDITIERSRWFCPGIGSVREAGKQVYLKRGQTGALCELMSNSFGFESSRIDDLAH